MPLLAGAPVVLRLLRLPRPEVAEELELLYDLAGALLFVRRDGADDHAYPIAREQVRHEADPEHVYVAVVPGEGKAFGQVGPYDVPVEDLHLPLPLAQLMLDDLGDGRLARPG